VATQRRSRRARIPRGDAVDLLTIPVTATRLGASEMHVYRLIASGDLRAVDISQPGSRKTKTRIRSDDLDDYIESRTRTAPAGDAA
jgi:excisionase family DNA binding protein